MVMYVNEKRDFQFMVGLTKLKMLSGPDKVHTFQIKEVLVI